MSVFGDHDVDEVPDSVFHIDDGTYYAEVVQEWEKFFPHDSGYQTKSVGMEFSINEPESNFHRKTPRKYFNFRPDVDWNDLESREQMALTNLKNTYRRGFDMTGEDMKNHEVGSLGGRDCYLNIQNVDGKGKNAGKKFQNIEVVSTENFKEENDSLGTTDFDL